MATIQSIATLMLDGDWIESKDQAECGIRLVQTGNVGIGEYLDKSTRAKYISEETFSTLKCTALKENDILISRLPDPVGRACLVPAEVLPAITAVDCTIVRLNNALCDNKFFVYHTQSTHYQKQLTQFLAGTTRTRISRKNLEKIEIPLPSIRQQKEIAAVLDKVSDLIALRKQQLAKLDELVKSRFVEMFGDPVTNPHGFEKVSLSELADIKIGPFGSLLHKEDYVADGHALVNPSHIVDAKIVTDTQLTLTDEKFAELSAYHLRIGDVVLGRRGEMGRCAVVETDGMLCGTGSLLIRTKGSVTADYIQKVISFPTFKKTI